MDVTTAPSTDCPTRWETTLMITICERCYVPISDGEPVVRLAHIDRAHADGSITWIHSYVHTAGCTMPRLAPHERPDPGDWDARRSIGVHRSP